MNARPSIMASARRACRRHGRLAVALLHGNRKKRVLSGVPPARQG
ncbi:hypothetical protein [Pseudoxanthomonas koreensis]